MRGDPKQVANLVCAGVEESGKGREEYGRWRVLLHPVLLSLCVTELGSRLVWTEDVLGYSIWSIS